MPNDVWTEEQAPYSIGGRSLRRVVISTKPRMVLIVLCAVREPIPLTMLRTLSVPWWEVRPCSSLCIDSLPRKDESL